MEKSYKMQQTLFLNQETKCLHSKYHHSLNNLRTPFRGYSGNICHSVFCFQNVQSSETPTTISKCVALVVTSSKMTKKLKSYNHIFLANLLGINETLDKKKNSRNHEGLQQNQASWQLPQTNQNFNHMTFL
jgi:hypothetical protein